MKHTAPLLRRARLHTLTDTGLQMISGLFTLSQMKKGRKKNEVPPEQSAAGTEKRKRNSVTQLRECFFSFQCEPFSVARTVQRVVEMQGLNERAEIVKGKKTFSKIIP